MINCNICVICASQVNNTQALSSPNASNTIAAILVYMKIEVYFVILLQRVFSLSKLLHTRVWLVQIVHVVNKFGVGLLQKGQAEALHTCGGETE